MTTRTPAQAEPWPATDRLPAGWMSPDECDYLSQWAAGKLVLELGSFMGRATVAMARTANHVVTVDHHQGSPLESWYTGFDSLPALRANLRQCGVAGKVTIVVADLSMFARFPILGSWYDRVLIDSGHDEGAVRRDSTIAFNACPDWSRMLWDDYDWPGVKPIVDEIASKSDRRVVREGKLARLA